MTACDPLTSDSATPEPATADPATPDTVTADPATTDPVGRCWRVVGDPLCAGAPTGPLRGLRVAVKDLFALAGHRVGAGVPAFLAGAGTEPAHATAVSRLLAGGADVVGVARTDQFAYSLTGTDTDGPPPVNAALPGAVPGGSSSGSATAVRTHLADVGLGTDTGGSIRVPASYQGLWGLRTTYGSVDRTGLTPLAPTFDTIGWLTRDGAALGRVTTWCCLPGADLPDHVQLLVPAETRDLLPPAVRDAFDRTVADWSPGTVTVGPLTAWYDTFRVVQAAEAWRTHGPWIVAHPDTLVPAVAARFAAAALVDPDQEATARRTLTRLRTRLRDQLGDRALVLPTTPGPAPALTADPADVRTTSLQLTALAGVAGLPALSVPAITVPSPLGPAPLGITLIGPPDTDRALVRLARRLVAPTEDAR